MTKYFKKTPIEAEQFDGSDEMAERYGFEKYLGSWGLKYTHSLTIEPGEWFVKLTNEHLIVVTEKGFPEEFESLPVLSKEIVALIQVHKDLNHSVSDMIQSVGSNFETKWKFYLDNDWNASSEILARAWINGWIEEEE